VVDEGRNEDQRDDGDCGLYSPLFPEIHDPNDGRVR
jgi:hypothetical protein